MWSLSPQRGTRITTGSQSGRSSSRDAAVDLVRAVALLRVIVYHASGNLAVITLVPAMPVMFFLGGRFVALSLDRRAASEVVIDRSRRLLVPAVTYIVVVIAGLIIAGHSARGVGTSFVNSLLPRGFSGRDTTADWYFSTLWYLRDYLVGVAISPLLLRALRARPRWMAIGTTVLIAVSFVLDLGSLSTMYLAFWLLGMAGAGGRAFAPRSLLPRWLTSSLAGIAVVGAGVLLATGSRPWSEAAGNLLAGLGWLTILGLANGPVTRFAVRPLVSRSATWLQQRAVSTYLWQMVPVIVLFDLAGIPGRALENAAQALWIIPAAIVATLAIAAVVAPIERRAVR